MIWGFGSGVLGFGSAYSGKRPKAKRNRKRLAHRAMEKATRKAQRGRR